MAMEHAELQKRILERMRSFGMTPVLPGFAGFVPPALVEKVGTHIFEHFVMLLLITRLVSVGAKWNLHLPNSIMVVLCHDTSACLLLEPQQFQVCVHAVED